MIIKILKRDGRIEFFDKKKIADAIFKAAQACGGKNRELAAELADLVVKAAEVKFVDKIPSVEDIQDLVEEVLINEGHAQTAKAYILYRERRQEARKISALIGETSELFTGYLADKDWGVKENANMQKSVNGLNNYVREHFTKKYWLYKVYPKEVREAHESGDIHLHDLGFFGPYCAGWDVRQLLTDGFGGVSGKVESRPAKHLRSFLGQLVNSTFTTQGETAGAQAWSSIDTYCAPFIYYDNMTYEQVRQCLQEFVFNINVPTRVGFQCPFSNLTFDIKVPRTLADQPVVVGGEYKDKTYKEFQKEMDIFNKAFCDVMLEGDSKGRVFTFPIPTINVTKEFDWNSDVVNAFMEITCKYGIPYFANYINSDLNPEDAVSMCCRLRLDVSELRKRGGGLFGSNPHTGSIGVVTINLPRIGYLSKTEGEFLERVRHMAVIAKTSLEIKRKIVEAQSERGLYPYSTHYLRGVKERTGEYWSNHFNTIGIVGMNEACLNFMGKDISTPEGQEFTIRVMNYMREIMVEFQKETGHMYNLEATPAEGTSYRLALLDKKYYPGIITAGEDDVYYTNSAQLPVGFGEDIMETVRLQDDIQSLFTGGTVQHLYLGESVKDINAAKKLIKKIFETSKMPYISITPTFSVCPNHGYIDGEHFTCPECGADAEVYTRVVGYLRPVQNFNNGKKEEWRERVKYELKPEQLKNVKL
ncbi:MAG TPA: ribonucleoside triphosphate reductase [Candidatus Limadaptatus stercorigallinarum]|uniref:Ribonucleoside triphosphate reductase n=1 Tax=Candidatus Limadaptatus stercorigallinarum TaxID=2840845 RepID=A0A9D1HRP6_9FIRM|nr:ribonucleoside triphosphate reductase [Candidatus Limadaptatus stercorigallinarum]